MVVQIKFPKPTWNNMKKKFFLSHNKYFHRIVQSSTSVMMIKRSDLEKWLVLFTLLHHRSTRSRRLEWKKTFCYRLFCGSTWLNRLPLYQSAFRCKFPAQNPLFELKRSFFNIADFHISKKKTCLDNSLKSSTILLISIQEIINV